MSPINQSISNRIVLLILEDYDAIRAMLANHFKANGYDVFSAATLRDALYIADEEKPQVVVIDYDLNGQDAYRAIEQVRALRPASYVILMGGPNTSDVEVKARAAGAARVVAKAYLMSELDTVIADATREMRRRKRTELEIPLPVVPPPSLATAA